MSKTLDELYDEIKNNKNLQEDLNSALKSNSKDSLQAFIKNNDCDATLEEAKKFLADKTQEMIDNGELTPEQLEAVNGGTIVGLTIFSGISFAAGITYVAVAATIC